MIILKIRRGFQLLYPHQLFLMYHFNNMSYVICHMSYLGQCPIQWCDQICQTCHQYVAITIKIVSSGVKNLWGGAKFTSIPSKILKFVHSNINTSRQLTNAVRTCMGPPLTCLTRQDMRWHFRKHLGYKRQCCTFVHTCSRFKALLSLLLLN